MCCPGGKIKFIVNSLIFKAVSFLKHGTLSSNKQFRINEKKIRYHTTFTLAFVTHPYRMSSFEDKLLVNAFLLTRSETVFRQLYRKHVLTIYRMALQLTNRDMIAAEEIAQETWIRAITHLKTFQWNSSLKTWLCGITINCAREWIRKNKAGIFTGEVNDISSFHPAVEMKIDMSNALAILPEGYREILVLHDMQGFKHSEISQLLGISEGTSKSQLFHARKAIQKLLN